MGCRRFRAHPRSRGENVAELIAPAATGGSSPLTRGKREAGVCCDPRSGLIPAHAGKTVLGAAGAFFRWAHPRSRGENLVEPYWVGTQQGSSPLTRGKRGLKPQKMSRGRLIPAHAGKTTHWLPSWRPLRGSSPLTRGKPSARGCESYSTGLIPAHAGKTCRASSIL